MDDIVGPLKQFLNRRDPSKIENFVFKLHVRLTFAIMCVCMALVRQSLFENINPYPYNIKTSFFSAWSRHGG